MDFGVDKAEVMLLKERVGEAQRLAIQELKDAGGAAGARGGRKRHRDREENGQDRRDRDDDMVEAGVSVLVLLLFHESNDNGKTLTRLLDAQQGEKE